MYHVQNIPITGNPLVKWFSTVLLSQRSWVRIPGLHSLSIGWLRTALFSQVMIPTWVDSFFLSYTVVHSISICFLLGAVRGEGLHDYARSQSYYRFVVTGSFRILYHVQKILITGSSFVEWFSTLLLSEISWARIPGLHSLSIGWLRTALFSQ